MKGRQHRPSMLIKEDGVAPEISAMTGRMAHMAEWTAQAPATAEDVSAFYRSSAHLGADLAELHSDPARAQWTAMFCDVAQDCDPRVVLDIGAGTGHDLRAIGAVVPAALRVAVEPNEHLAQKLQESGTAQQVFASLDMVRGQADLVLCVDVLEHVPDPDTFLASVIAKVPVGGILIEATATHNTWTATHLPENWGWMPASHLRKAGFRLQRVFDYCNVWRRVAERGKTDSATVMAFLYRSAPPSMVQQLLQVERAGWHVHLVHNDALIARSRGQALSYFLRQSPDDVCLMVDADIVFDMDDARRVVDLCRRNQGVAVGIYTLRGARSVTIRPLKNTSITFAADAEPVDIEYGATGFMAIHRTAAERMQRDLPLVHAQNPELSHWPFFDPPHVPKVVGPPENRLYLSEDWHFCAFAHQLGIPVQADPGVLIGHLGDYVYTVRDHIALREAEGGGSDAAQSEHR